MTTERLEDKMEPIEKKKKVKKSIDGKKIKKKEKNTQNLIEESPSSMGKKRKMDSREKDLDPAPKKKPKKGILKNPKNLKENDQLSSSATGEEMMAEAETPPLVNPCFQPSADSNAISKKDKMRKKRELKRAAKSSAQEAKKNDAGEEIRRLEAQEYLRCWKSDKDRWKFNKNRQTWLLKNLFLPDALDDDTFGILLEYLRPLKGKAREETIKQAEAKVNESGVDFLQAERARVVAQMLA